MAAIAGSRCFVERGAAMKSYWIIAAIVAVLFTAGARESKAYVVALQQPITDAKPAEQTQLPTAETKATAEPRAPSEAEANIAAPAKAEGDIEGLKITDLKPGLIYSWLRKPDFQRETNHWTPEQLVTFIESFVDSEVIPSLIL